MVVHTDCRHYCGDIPCKLHKAYDVHCDGCPHYLKIKERILIIKLGAIGDVIRTTPLLRKLKEVYPDAQIHWLTHTPEILPAGVDRVYRYDLKSLETIKQTPFDLLINLDKDREACALTNVVQAKNKKGFHLVDGNCHPIDDKARYKWITGLFDDENRRNTKSYPQEIFDICGFPYQGEEYILEVKEQRSWNLPKDKTRIGLNTGCGERWKTRLWPDTHWTKLAKLLMKEGYDVIFLGGQIEDTRNKDLSKKTNARYVGHFSLPVFIDLMNQCHVVVTAVTMALHIALGLKKKVVLFNNIFNRHEFELFGRGVILEPPNACLGCFKNECEDACMELIRPEDVLDGIHRLLE